MQHVIASYVRKKEHLWGLRTHFLHFFAYRMEGQWILPISPYFCDFLGCEQFMVKLVTTLNLEKSKLSINFVVWHHLFWTMTSMKWLSDWFWIVTFKLRNFRLPLRNFILFFPLLTFKWFLITVTGHKFSEICAKLSLNFMFLVVFKITTNN